MPRRFMPQRRATKTLAVVGLTFAALVGLGVIGFFVITDTDWGRERVRRILVSQIQKQASGGRVRIARVTGNLREGITLHDVVITDKAGAPFLAADSLSARYKLLALWRRRVHLDDVLIARPTIVLDRPPDGEWNWKRIFPGDTLPASRDTTPGFGDWLRFTDVTLVDGTVVSRSPWRPSRSMSAAQQDSAVREILRGESRLRVERVPNGYQKIVELRDLDAQMPLVQLADPAVAERIIDVASARVDAYPFRPPAAEIRALQGRFAFTGDSLWWRGIAVRMPGSALTGDGMYVLDNGDMWIRTRARPVAHADFRWLYPRLPSRGGGPLDLDLTWKGSTQKYVVRNADLRIDRQRMQGAIAIAIDDDVVIDSSDVRFAGLDTRTLEQLIESLDVPRRGTLDGRARLRGTQADMRVDANVAFNDAQGTGTSRVAAVGQIGYEDRGRTAFIRARNLRVRLLPLRLELAQAFAPSLPFDGTLTGDAVLNGSTDRGLDVNGSLALAEDGTVSRARGRASVRLNEGNVAYVDANVRLDPLAMPVVAAFVDSLPIGGTLEGPVQFRGTFDRFVVSGNVTHRDNGLVSRVDGRANVRLDGTTYVDAALNLRPLALPTVAAFAPDAGLRGSISGPLTIRGTMDDLTVRGTISAAGGGTIAGGGRVRLGGRTPGYDVAVTMRDFDASAITSKAPTTDLTGRASVAGAGTDPGTMTANVALNLDASSVEGAAVDSAIGTVRVANGLASVGRLQVRGQGLIADASGTFGLRRDRTGTLTFNVAAPSIAPFARYVPGSSEGAVAPRPGVLTARLRRAQADSARIARATEVERAISGRPPIAVPVDTPRAIARSAVQGSLFAAGRATGNIYAFVAQGRVAGENLVVRGNAARRLQGEFAWNDARTSRSTLTASLRGDSLSVAGFELDSADARVAYTAPNGRLALALFQGPERDYALRGDFTIADGRSALVAREVQLRLDSTTYTAPRPFTVAWGGSGVTVDNLELVSSRGGRIFADGRLPTEGSANLNVAIADFQVGDVLTLLQSDIELRGLVTAEGRLQGTLAAPRFAGAAGLVNATLDETPVPDLRARFTYAGQVLTARVEALQANGAVLAVADGTVPANLALSGVTGPRFPGEGLRVDVVADSLPLDLLPQFTDVVSNTSGRAAGRIRLTGALDRPNLTGAISLENAAAKVEPLGIEVKQVAGLVRMAGDTVIVDSLVAVSDGGPIRVRGGLGVGNFREPSFDLYLTADDAKVLDNDLGEVWATAGLALRGPWTDPYLSGQATVTRGAVYAPSGPSKRLVSAGDPAIYAVLDTSLISDRELLPASSSPLLRNLRADLDVVVNRNTWVRSRDLNIELFTETPLQVNVANEEVRVTGLLSSDRGEYEVLSKRFEVNRATALFVGTPDINPTVNLTAEYEVRLPSRPAINVKILVGGTVKNPRISLESDAQPPISQTDLLSFLAFGTESQSVIQIAGSAITAGPSGSYAGQGLPLLATERLFAVALGLAVDEAEGDASRALGVDVFNIRPADLPERGGISQIGDFLLGTEVEAGKYVNPRTFIAVEGTFPGQKTWVPPGIRLQHRAPKGFRIETAYEPRFLLRNPTLISGDRESTIPAVGSFGALLIREWRF